MPDHQRDCFYFLLGKRVAHRPHWFAQWEFTGRCHRITISSARNGQLVTLVASLGHEMCHLAVHEARQNTGGNENTHNSAFRKLAARFCRIHGVDPKAFY
jgi:hypothetical protein